MLTLLSIPQGLLGTHPKRITACRASQSKILWHAQIDLRSDYERKQDGMGLLVKNARVVRAGREGAPTLKASGGHHTPLRLPHMGPPGCPPSWTACLALGAGCSVHVRAARASMAASTTPSRHHSVEASKAQKTRTPC